MFFKTVTTIARFSLLLIPVAAATAASCGDSGSDGAGGSAGTSGSGGTTGAAGTGGSGGGNSTLPTCTPVVVPVGDANVLDFTSLQGAAATFMYAAAPSSIPTRASEADLKGLDQRRLDRQLARHRTGPELRGHRSLPDVQARPFDVRGHPVRHPGDVHGQRHGCRRRARRVGHDDRGRCADGRGYGAQRDAAHLGHLRPRDRQPVRRHVRRRPTKAIPLTGTPVTQMVHWSDLTGGKKVGGSNLSPDPTQITSIAWVLPWGGRRLGSVHRRHHRRQHQVHDAVIRWWAICQVDDGHWSYGPSSNPPWYF